MKSLFFSLIIYCLMASPLWASDIEEEEYQFQMLGNIITPQAERLQARFQIIPPYGRPVIEQLLDLAEVEHIGFQQYLSQRMNENLDPLRPLPQDLGFARKRLKCTFIYNHQEYQWEGVDRRTQYPLQGQWHYQEDRDRQQTLAELRLKLQLGDQTWHEISQVQKMIPHRLIRTDAEIPIGLHFDGITVYKKRTALQHWQEPRTRQEYSKNAIIQDGEVPTHEDGHIVYVQPFAFRGDQARARDDYIGDYNFDRHLAEHEKNQLIDVSHLIYSTGNDLYLPHITQELWQRNQSRVCFLIASFSPHNKIKLDPAAYMEEQAIWPEGLYLRSLVQQNNNERIEQWRNLNTHNSVTIENHDDKSCVKVSCHIKPTLTDSRLKVFSDSKLVNKVILDPDYDVSAHHGVFFRALQNWAELETLKVLSRIEGRALDSFIQVWQSLPSSLKKISIYNRVSFSSLANSLNSFVNLTTLNVKEPELSGPDGEIFAQQLSQLRCLQHLKLTNEPWSWKNKMTREMPLRLVESLYPLGNLITIDFTNLKIGGSAATAIANNLNHWPHLKHLILADNNKIVDYNQLFARGIHRFFNQLFNQRNRPAPQNTNEAESDDMLDEPFCISLSQNLNQIPQLTTLNLEANEISEAGMSALGRNLRAIPQIKDLIFTKNTLGTNGSTEIAKSFRYLSKLSRLELGKCRISDEGARALSDNVQHLTNLTSLDLSYGHFNQEHRTCLLNALVHIAQLEFLNLRDCRIGDEDERALLTLFSRLTLLKHLDLGSNKLRTRGLVSLGNALRFVPDLFYLDLGSNNISNEGMITLAAGLQHATQLRTLRLQKNCYIDSNQNQFIGDRLAGIREVARQFRYLTLLESFNISDNNIGDGGAIAVAEGLQFLPHLRYLELSNNNIGPPGTIAIAHALRHVPELCSLLMRENGAGLVSRSRTTEEAQAFAQNLHFVPLLQQLSLAKPVNERWEEACDILIRQNLPNHYWAKASWSLDY